MPWSPCAHDFLQKACGCSHIRAGARELLPLLRQWCVGPPLGTPCPKTKLPLPAGRRQQAPPRPFRSGETQPSVPREALPGCPLLPTTISFDDGYKGRGSFQTRTPMLPTTHYPSCGRIRQSRRSF